MAVGFAALYFALPPDPPDGISSVASVWLRLDLGAFLDNWGGWLALILFAIVTWVLVAVPLRAVRREGGGHQ